MPESSMIPEPNVIKITNNDGEIEVLFQSTSPTFVDVCSVWLNSQCSGEYTWKWVPASPYKRCFFKSRSDAGRFVDFLIYKGVLK